MPVRLIREGILTSARVSKLGWAEEVFFRRLMSVVDDFGRYYADPGLLRAACYPRQLKQVSDEDISSWLDSLVANDLIKVYTSDDDEPYVEMLRFGQQVRAKRSKYPDPISTAEQTCSDCEAVAKQLQTDAHLDVDVFGDVDVDDKKAPTVLVPEAQEPASVDPPKPSTGLPDCPAKEVVALYHEILPELPKVERLTDARRAAMRQRWREWAVEKGWRTPADGLADWRKFFAYIRGSPFLMGRTRPLPPRTTPFIADIDFLMAPASHTKIFEGKYHEAAAA